MLDCGPPNMRLMHCTWPEVAALDRVDTVLLLPLGAVEAHGPHLPLGTDVVIADAMCEAAARELQAVDRTAVILPALAYSAAPWAGEFPGTVSIDGATTVRLLSEIAAAWDQHGFRQLVVVNSHFDPAHVLAVRSAVESITADPDIGLVVTFPDLTRRRLAELLTDEFQSGACHAGRYEGSIVLAARPDLVRSDVMSSLPPHPVSLSEGIREGTSSFAELGGNHAYFGHPSEATAAEGKATLQVLGRIVAEAAIGGQRTDSEGSKRGRNRPGPR